MVSVLLIWFVLFFISWPIGAVVVLFLSVAAGTPIPFEQIRSRDLASFSYAGLVVLTVYSQIFSLFHGVSGWALLGGVILAIVAAFILLLRIHENKLSCPESGTGAPASFQRFVHRRRHEVFGLWHLRVPHVVFRVLLFLALVVVCAYLTSRGYMHYDSDLYHAQAIHWIESYGAVPGLANLHNRLGYNSAALVLSALFSFSFIGSQSFHVVQGYLYLLLLLECMRIFKKGHLLQPVSRLDKENKGIWYSDFLRIAGLFYLFQIADEIVAPATDYFMVLATFWLLIRWLEEDAWFPLALLSLLAVWIITIKLSGVMLLLLAVYPAAQVIRKRKWKAFLLFFVCATGIVGPFLIRNVVLSGYLVYPFPALDLFSFDWKVPAAAALSDQREIMVWGRGYSDVTRYQMPLAIWLDPWFHKQNRTDQILILTAGVGVLGAVIGSVGSVLFKKECIGSLSPAGCKEIKPCRVRLVSVEITLVSAAVFWLHGGPLMRYGCVFVYSLASLNAGLFLNWLMHLLKYHRLFLFLVLRVLLLVWLIYKIAAVGRAELRWLQLPYYFVQQDYGQYEVVSWQLDGFTFYSPVKGDQAGYAAFPSSPVRRNQSIMLRGNSVKDGFRMK